MFSRSLREASFLGLDDLIRVPLTLPRGWWTFTLLSIAILVTIGTEPSAAQERRNRATGVVTGAADEPLQGAIVTLVSRAGFGERAPSTATDERGRWIVAGLAVGEWEVTIEADGYVPVTGSIVVSTETSDPVRVEMLPILATVDGILAEGNRLLESGDSAGARLQFERALMGLPAAQHPEVLRAIARSFYVEGDLQGAVTSLHRALLTAPDDQIARDLLSLILEQQGRGEEASSWLACLDAEGVQGVAVSQTDTFLAAVEKHTASSDIRGRFRTTFDRQSPLSAIDEFCRRFEESSRDVEKLGTGYVLSEESYEVYVPQSCAKEAPCGVFVWISPTDWGGIPDREIVPILDARKLIWVGANRSGNQRKIRDRVGLALDAWFNLRDVFAVRPDRVFVGGYSGGGRVATALAIVYPEVFLGGLFYMGTNFYRDLRATNRPGAFWPAWFPGPSEENMETLRDCRRLAFVTGSLDFNRSETKAVRNAYVEDGFGHTSFIEISGMTHFDGFDLRGFTKGIEAIDPGPETDWPCIISEVSRAQE